MVMPNAAVNCKGDSRVRATASAWPANRDPTRARRPVAEPLRWQSDFPTSAIMMVDVSVSRGTICRFQMFPVPFQHVANTIGDVAKQSGLCEWPGISERAGGRAARLAGLNPLLVMADRLLEKRRRRHESAKGLFG